MEQPKKEQFRSKKASFLKLDFYEYLLILAGVFLVFRAKWICDDGYIFFRYVDNLVIHKIGLVFNLSKDIAAPCGSFFYPGCGFFPDRFR
jgi:hypothetical protein